MLSQLLCPVCESELDSSKLKTMMLNTPRGKQPWAQCSACRSFFAVEQYDPKREVEHTRTRPWGMVENGVALNEAKAPMYDAILRVLCRYVTQGNTILDIGCSFGGFLLRAQKEGYGVRGIDIVPEAVTYLHRQGIDCVCANSIEGLAIGAEPPSVISVLDCNYYWPNQRKELRAIHSRLAPQGILVMKVVDLSWLMQIGFWLQHWFPEAGRYLCEKAVYDHRVSIPVRSLLETVRKEGFDVFYTSQRDSMQFRRNSLKVKAAYAFGWLALRLTGCYLAPGFVLLARKRAL